MAADRFDVRVPPGELEHYAAWRRAAAEANLSWAQWVVQACNRALDPRPAPGVAPLAPAPAPPDDRRWWEAGLWAGRLERAFEADQVGAVSWTALRRWAAAYPGPAQALTTWAAAQSWGERWGAIWRNP